MKNFIYSLLSFFTFTTGAFTFAQTCTADVSITPTGNPGEVFIQDLSTLASTSPNDYSGVYFLKLPNYDFYDNVPLRPNSLTATYQFNDNGDYQYGFEVYDSISNCYDSVVGTLTISDLPYNCDASFTHGDTVNNEHFFYASTNDPNLDYSWDFGDGTFSNNPFEYHTYANSGTYNVCLTIWDSATTGQNCADTVCQTVVINSTSSPCYAGFTHYDTLNQNFFIPDTYDPNLSYYWEYGDGSNSYNPYGQHSYPSPGTYNVCLNIWDPVTNCADTVCQSVTITSNNTMCDANFYLFQDSVNTSQYYAWNLSVGNNLDYLWDFGDGTTSAQQYPTHTYSNVGLYNICLTINDPLGNCNDTYCDSIAIYNKASGTSLNVLPFGDYGQTAGIEENALAETSVKLYPNPASYEISLAIKSNEQEEITYTLLDVTGKTVLNGKVQISNDVTEEKINVQSLRQGVYFMKIDGGNNLEHIETLKFIKK